MRGQPVQVGLPASASLLAALGRIRLLLVEDCRDVVDGARQSKKACSLANAVGTSRATHTATRHDTNKTHLRM